MTNYQILSQELMDGFQKNKGRGSIFLYPPINPHIPLFNVITHFKNKNVERTIIVVIKKYEDKLALLEVLKKALPNEENYNYYTYKLNFITESYVNFNYKYEYDLAILIGISDISVIQTFSSQCKFCLAILTDNKINNFDTTILRNNLPDIHVSVSEQQIRHDNVIQPVKERRYAVDFLEDDLAKYTKYADYIRDSIKIFGSIENINLCRTGDRERNVSAKDICLAFATDNGWSYDLDTSIEINKEIDSYFNPNAIAERAQVTFNIIQERKKLLFTNQAKINVILDIVRENINKKILIMSKHGEFAHDIAEAINTSLGSPEAPLVCGEYHDSIPETYITDENGNVITYKSKKSPNYGHPKLFGSQALSTHYLNLFNNNHINILSCKNNGSKGLKCAVDLIIFTSSLEMNIIEFKQRYKDVISNQSIGDVRRIYTRGTLEEKQLINEPRYSNIEVLTEDIAPNIQYNDENGEIII